jgi:hypothetical protein
MLYSLKYLAWGLISNAALSAYYWAPRETLQDELINLHRYAMKKAHTARVKGQMKNGISESDNDSA